LALAIDLAPFLAAAKSAQSIAKSLVAARK
jgi:hypothetical protein